MHTVTRRTVAAERDSQSGRGMPCRCEFVEMFWCNQDASNRALMLINPIPILPKRVKAASFKQLLLSQFSHWFITIR
jgi:hypothetical protein